MQWKHKVSLEWLKERQAYLTASDVKSLVPVTKTGRPRKVGDLEKLKILAYKRIVLTEEDCWSYDAAARGHLLEPFAIDAFNDTEEFDHLFHWDDKIIAGGIPGSLAFSPDALDVPMHEPRAITKATVLGEVKCYGAAKHYEVSQTPLEHLDERWQIATAMAVAPNIGKAYLILFNPDVVDQLFVIEIQRADLEDEIEMIRTVEDEWLSYISSSPVDVIGMSGRSVFREVVKANHIIADIEQRQRLNP